MEKESDKKQILTSYIATVESLEPDFKTKWKELSGITSKLVKEILEKDGVPFYNLKNLIESKREEMGIECYLIGLLILEKVKNILLNKDVVNTISTNQGLTSQVEKLSEDVDKADKTIKGIKRKLAIARKKIFKLEGIQKIKKLVLDNIFSGLKVKVYAFGESFLVFFHGEKKLIVKIDDKNDTITCLLSYLDNSRIFKKTFSTQDFIESFSPENENELRKEYNKKGPKKRLPLTKTRPQCIYFSCSYSIGRNGGKISLSDFGKLTEVGNIMKENGKIIILVKRNVVGKISFQTVENYSDLDFSDYNFEANIEGFDEIQECFNSSTEIGEGVIMYDGENNKFVLYSKRESEKS
ncbi:MAG: hypothetical protein PHE25_03465 [Candidatus Gracilibacteria bacterium]|nr:hypothetical protein [Candidatus Gracilibacteria bacterium]